MTKGDEQNDQPVRSVNSQITDAVTQSNMMLTGMAPAHSMAALYQTMAQSMGTSLQNAVSNQQNVNTVNIAALTQNLQTIMQPHPRPQSVQMPPIVLQPTFVNRASNGNDSDDDKPTRSSKK